MMDRPPETPYTEQHWYTRRKRLLRIGFGVFSLLALIVLAGLLYIRTGRLNRFISSQVVEALAEYGLRAEIGSFNITWGVRTAKIGDIRIYNQQTGQLIATIDQAEMEVQIREPFAFQLRREIIFKRLELTKLNLRIDVDELGRSNLQGLRQAPPQASRLKFDFSSLVAAIRGGEAHISDRSRKIEGNLGNIELNAQPLPGIEKVKAQLATRGGRLRYEGREISLEGLDLLVTGGSAGAQIEQFALRTPVIQSSASGQIDDWKAPRYAFSIHTQVTLEEIERMLEPNAGLRGGATVDAKIEGVERTYKIDVKLSSDDLAAYGGRFKGVHGQGQVEGSGRHYKVAADLSSNEIVASGAQIHGVKIEGFKAEDDGAKIKFETRRAYAQKAVAQNARLIDLSAGAIRGESSSGRIHANAPQAAVDKIEFEQGQISGVSLKTIDAELEHGRYRASGSMAIKDGVVSGAAVGPLDGDLVADNKSVSLNKFKASLFGGNASGDIVFNLEGGGDSRLKSTFDELKTNDVFAVASTGRAPLAGRFGGAAELSWPGMDFLAASGAVNIHLKAETTQTVDAIPVTGDVSLRARGGVFDIEQLLLNTDASQVTATGHFSRDGTSDLRFSLTSKNAEQLQTIAYSIEEIRKSVEAFEPQLLGDFKFEGRLQGPFKDPTLEGDLKASNVLLHDEPLGAISGHLSFSPSEVKFENGALAAANGGSAKFSYSAPRDALGAEGRLDVTVERISADTMIGAAGLPPGQKFFSGDISGEAHLTGLPDVPKGTATINLIDGMIGGQAAELTRASLVFDGSSVRLNRAEARLPQGRLTADGDMNLKSYDFQVKGRVEKLDLAALVNASETANLATTGTVNADIKASGNAKDIEQLNLELTAEGQNVTINGRQAGQLNLTARTSQNGRVDIDLITGIAGKPQPAHASIELRKPGRPIEVSADLTSLDLAPLLASFAPNLSSSIAGNIGGKLRITGPTVNDKGEATINALKGSLSLDSISLEVSGRTLTIQTPLTVMMNGPELTIERTRITGDGVDLALGGTLGLSEDAKLDFKINGTADLEAIARLNPDYFMDGKATVNVQLMGPFRAPQLGGEIVLDDVSFSSIDLQYNVEHGYGRLVMAGDKVTLEYFTATANDGTLNLTGVLTLDQLQPKEWRLDMSTNYAIVYYQGAQITLYGDVTLTGDPQGQSLTGLITIPQAEYTSDFDLERLTSSGGDLGSGLGIGYGGSSLPRTNLDIRVEANDSILIRNEQVNTVGSASLRVVGLMTDPFITGRVNFEGGTIKFRSQRYEITAGTIDFPPGGGLSPQVNFLTEGDVSGYHVYVGLTGPITDMDVTLRSEPELARSEVLSLVTTGRADSDTLGSEDLFRSGAGTAASLLTQEFISKPAESLLGLSRFQIDPIFRPNSNPAARLTIGRQLARNLAFTYSTNLGSEQDQTALTEYTLTNRFSGIASYTQGGTSTRGGNKDSDFTIEFRGRRRFSLGFESADSPASNPLGNSKAPPRREREPLPRAEVSMIQPDVVKLSDKRLRELAPVMKEGFSLPLARLGERNLTNYLQEHGYFFATVRSRCQPIECVGPNLKLFYDVEPGQRLDLERIRLEGTERISLGDVSGEFQTKAKSVVGSVPFFKNLPWIGGLARGVTSNDRLQHDREVVRRHMVDLGFRSARVGSRLAFSPESEDLTVIFSVEEGPRSTIADVMFRGNSVLAVDELRKAAPVKDEEAFSPALIRSGTTNIKKLYADQGYLDAVVSAEVVDLPNDQVRLIYSVEEGAKNVASEVVISGQTKTHEASIRRFLSFNTGDTLTPDLIRQTQRDLYATGAFREVTVRAEPKPGEDESARRVSIGVTEAKPLLFVYGLGYSTDEGPRGLAQVSNTNLFGRVNSASIRMRASRREQLAQFSYTDLRPFGTKWATTISTFYDRNTNLQTIQRKQIVDGEVQIQDPQSFGINRFAAFIQTERKLSEKSALRFRYSFENARLTNAQNIPIGEIGRNNRSIRLGSFSIGLTRDTRDSALTPTRGQLMSAEHTVAARIFGGNEAFHRFFGTYQAYKTFEPSTPFIRDSTFAFSARIGLAAPFRVPMTSTLDDKLLPISERFFAGGATTLRGFRFEQAGPQIILESTRPGELPALVPRGGNALTVFNFEFRYPLTRRVRLVPFYDVGNVFLQVRDIRFKDMSNTVGLGLRFNTPIGPVGVDYGYLLNPPSFVTQGNATLRRPHGVVHIRLGQSF